MNELLPCPKCFRDPRVCAYCDLDLRAQGARVVVHADHVCLIVGGDPPAMEKLRRLEDAAMHRTRAERIYAYERN